MPVALAALDNGGTLAVAGIHLSDIPPLNYDEYLFRERTLTSVTANTRADGVQLLALATELNITARTTVYPFHRAPEALRDPRTASSPGPLSSGCMADAHEQYSRRRLLTKVPFLVVGRLRRSGRSIRSMEDMARPTVVRDVMSAPVAVVRDYDSAGWALVRFTETGLRHLVVLDRVGRLVGVLDDRRILALWPLDALGLHRQTVGDLVRPPGTTPEAALKVHPDTALSTAAHLMLRFQVDGLPVIDDNQVVVGIVTGSDLVRALLRLVVEEDEPQEAQA